MKAGDVIRVQDWPGTRGRRFVVHAVSEGRVDAVSDGKLRSFPRDHCHVDRRATRAREEGARS